MNYDFSRWHKGCTNKQLVDTSDGVHIVCLDCGVSANLEAISGKISPSDACKVGTVDRKVEGKQSSNVDRGGNVQ